jgi:hypothetical protein
LTGAAALTYPLTMHSPRAESDDARDETRRARRARQGGLVPRGLRGAAACMIAASWAGCHPATLPGAVTPAMGADPGWALVPRVPLVRQRGQADCGVAALAMVVRFWQPAATADEVRSALAFRPDEPGVEAGRLRNVARTRGLAAFLVEGTLDDLSHEVERGRPVIVGLVRRAGRKAVAHYVVVVGVNRQRQHLLTADPQHGWTEVSQSTFDSEWQPAHRLTMVVLPHEATPGGDRAIRSARPAAGKPRATRATPRTGRRGRPAPASRPPGFRAPRSTRAARRLACRRRRPGWPQRSRQRSRGQSSSAW